MGQRLGSKLGDHCERLSEALVWYASPGKLWLLPLPPPAMLMALEDDVGATRRSSESDAGTEGTKAAPIPPIPANASASKCDEFRSCGRRGEDGRARR